MRNRMGKKLEHSISLLCSVGDITGDTSSHWVYQNLVKSSHNNPFAKLLLLLSVTKSLKLKQPAVSQVAPVTKHAPNPPITKYKADD